MRPPRPPRPDAFDLACLAGFVLAVFGLHLTPIVPGLG